MASRFRITDRWDIERWFDLAPGQFIQGLLATLGLDKRVYVVTVPLPDRLAAEVTEFSTWPRIIRGKRLAGSA